MSAARVIGVLALAILAGVTFTGVPLLQGDLAGVTAVLALPLESVVWPIPPFPYVLAPYIVLGWIVIGFIWMTILGRRNPEALSGASTIWSTD